MIHLLATTTSMLFMSNGNQEMIHSPYYLHNNNCYNNNCHRSHRRFHKASFIAPFHACYHADRRFETRSIHDMNMVPSPNNNDFFDDDFSYEGDSSNSIENIEITPLQDGEDISEDILLQLQEGQPGELSIMKELLGINGLTYVLAGLIVFFLTMNGVLGPGWLGQLMGLEGTGTFTQISDSLPDNVDLSQPENLI